MTPDQIARHVDRAVWQRTWRRWRLRKPEPREAPRVASWLAWGLAAPALLLGLLILCRLLGRSP